MKERGLLLRPELAQKAHIGLKTQTRRPMAAQAMTTASAAAIVHRVAGSPSVDSCEDTACRCWLCAGESQRSMLVRRWQGANFTDQNKATKHDSDRVCEPCVWATSWVQPPGFPPPPPGKKGLNLRLFSHLYDERGYLALNKASKLDILRWLREPKRGPWFAAIADTGQKHVLPWTPLNPEGGRLVRFEERTLSLGDWDIVDAVVDLLSAGVTKAELQTGDYTVRSYQAVGIDWLKEFEDIYGRMRGGAWFDLALWLSQRDEERYGRRKTGGATTAHGGRATRVEGSVSGRRRQSAQTLAADPRPAKGGGEDDVECGRVGDVDAAGTEDLDAQQQALDFDS